MIRVIPLEWNAMDKTTDVILTAKTPWMCYYVKPDISSWRTPATPWIRCRSAEAAKEAAEIDYTNKILRCVKIEGHK